MALQNRVPRNPAIHPYIKRPVLDDHVATTWVMPDLCSRYKFPTGVTGGGVIAIIELGGGWTAADMAAYFASIEQPVPSITDISVDGTTNSPGADADFEVALDIQVSAAAYYEATGKPASIRVYWAQDIATAVRAAAADRCDVCSISWGADEASWNAGTGPGSCADMQAAATDAIVAGMVVFAASGDNDSSDGGPNAANVDCPASCPDIVGCGGTTLTDTTETVWNNNPGNADGEGTGGGYSTVFPAQAWQIGVPPAPSGLGRMVPDVASDADPNTGIEIFCQGAAQIVGGTSAAAPLWAGLVAACGKKKGFITPSLYLNAQAFTAIVSGDNGYYQAGGRAPNPCCGMGSPIGTMIAAVLGSPVAPPVTTTPAPGTTSPPTTRPPVTTQPPRPTTTPAPPKPTTTPAPTTTLAPGQGHHHHHHHHGHGGRRDDEGMRDGRNEDRGRKR
jgi:kumamolisin